MEKEKKVNYEVAMIGLDLTEMDDKVIAYMDILMNVLPLQRVIFVHIAEKLELPAELTDKYPDLLAPMDENIAHGIDSKVAPLFEGKDIAYDVIVQEGPSIETFLRLSKIKNADLIVLGRKKSLKGSGILSNQIVRKSPASILFVTETFNPSMKRVLVPVDFSKHSVLSLHLARKLQEAGVAIHFAHLYNVPIGFYKTGKSHKEFAEIMKGHAMNDMKQFLWENKVEETYPCEYILADDQPKAHLINNHAHESGMDLILIGSRGRTKSSALLIGSIVEKVLQLDSDIPILVVKSRGENMGFFEALMKL
ncbi:universal stress protein [Ekhidna sp.]|uniref:universal stress protein n=1 Tax=Ekhidna sp. TaxID=2608089 RepID=UPI003B51344A